MSESGMSRRRFGVLAGGTALAGWLLPAAGAWSAASRAAVTPLTLPKIAWFGPGTTGIQGIAVSPDGTIVATAAQDTTVKLWRVADGSLLHTLAGHPGGVNSVTFTPDGQFVVSGGELVFGGTNGNVKLWRVGDGAFLGDFDHKEGTFAFSVDVSPDGTLLAAGHQGGQVNIWRVADRSLVRTIQADNSDLPQVFSVAFSPNGALLAVGTGNGTVGVYRAATGTLVTTLTGHTFIVKVAFSADGTVLASGGFEGNIKLWRASNFTLIRTISTGDNVNDLAFASDGRTIASAGTDLITLWQVLNGARVRIIKAPSVSSLAYIAATTVAAGSFDSHVRLWRASDGAPIAQFGKHTGDVRSVAFSPNGALFASGSGDFTARLWRATDGADVQVLAEQSDIINAVAFSADSALVATGAGSPPPDTLDTSIKIWKVGATASIRTLPGHAGGSTGLAFAHDGASLYSTGRDGVLATWNLSDGSVIRFTRTGTPNGALALSPNGAVLATAGGTGAVNFYDAATSALLRTVTTNGPVSALSFSPDGTRIAVGTARAGDAVQVIEVATGTVLSTLPTEPVGIIQGTAWSPDGRLIASGSGYSQVLQLWDANTSALLNTYDEETGAGTSPQMPVAFAPSSALLGYGRGDATVVVIRTA